MKRLVISLGVLATWTSVAHADIGFSKDGITNGLGFTTDDVDLELYGILDVGYGTLAHSYSGNQFFASTVNPYNLNSSSKSYTGFFSGGVSMSRVGLKGEKDLGSDVKVFFKLESAIDANDGNISNNGRSIYENIHGLTTANGASAIDGQPFSRAAYVGVSYADFGSLEVGRTTNFSLDQVAEYDPVQAALLFSPLGFSGGIGGGLGATENTRLDNSLKYENKISNVDFGFQYRFATSTSDQNAESAYVAMLGYSDGPVSVKGTYSRTTNTVAWATQYSNVVAPDSNLQIENTSGYMLSGKYDINSDATVKVGYEYATINAPSDTNLTDIVKYYGINLPDAAANATGEQLFGTFWTGGDYKFTKDLDVGIGYYNIDTWNSPEVGKEYRSNIFSLLADYIFYRGLDTYVGAMLIDYTGPGLDKHAPTLAVSNNAIYGAGVRLKF